ncbi:trypsin-like serine peptidase [Gimesia chilikensis]|uniref:trypsin-like serine peptidase n=1 Tax=Gimesia chilikensis TaxID=2605989 RepID=UPI003A8E917C
MTDEWTGGLVLSPDDWEGDELGTRLLQVAEAAASQPVLVEAVFGENTLRDISILEEGLRVSRTVGRVTRGPGTGFLIAQDLLMTNNHVLPNAGIAEGEEVWFNYQRSSRSNAMLPEKYVLDPDGFFYTNIELDFSVVRVKGDPGLKWGFLLLQNQNPRAGTAAIVIQHPNGKRKKISLGDNEIKEIVAGGAKLQYLTDTMPGSSGSPIFDEAFNLIGLHHASTLTPDKLRYFRNEGIHINAIIANLPDEVPTGEDLDA